MVKHQRRSHQRGMHSSEVDDSMSETGSEDSPTTPKSHAAMPWSTHHVPMLDHHGHQLQQRAASFADFGQHMNNYGLQQQYSHRHSLSSGGAAEYQGPPHNQVSLHSHDHAQQQPQQHPSVQMLQRTASLPHHSYFVPDQNNPGVATMNTNPHAAAQHSHYHQMPRQGVERLPLEIPYTTAQGLTSSIQNSPSSFSAGSGRSPSAQDGFYTHAPPPPQAAASYALHTASSPVEHQTPQMVTGFHGQLPTSQAAAAAAAAAAAHAAAQAMTQTPTQQQQQQQQEQQQQPQAQAAGPGGAAQPEAYQHAQQVDEQQQSQPQSQQQQQWYDGVAYQPPVEVATIGSIPAYGSGVYDPWGPKLEFEDPSMQLPSARIASM